VASMHETVWCVSPQHSFSISVDEPPGSLTPPTAWTRHLCVFPSSSTSFRFKATLIHVLFDSEPLQTCARSRCLTSTAISARARAQPFELCLTMMSFILMWLYYLYALPLAFLDYLYAVLYSILTVDMWFVFRTERSSFGTSHSVDFHSGLPISTTCLVFRNTT